MIFSFYKITYFVYVYSSILSTFYYSSIKPYTNLCLDLFFIYYNILSLCFTLFVFDDIIGHPLNILNILSNYNSSKLWYPPNNLAIAFSRSINHIESSSDL